MAGVTDLPFRELCRKLGAGMTVSEMVTADSRLWNSRKSSQRLRHDDEATPRSVQIVGNNPAIMADAAQKTVALGAEIIDINMGCPAKKVCKQAAGSALLKNEKLVSHILCAVVEAVDVPVTLKIRTGWSPEHRNATTIGRIAEDAGIAALAVHGRTRSCRFHGTAEYDTIAEVVDTVNIPVIANGDITSPQQARQILKHTGASAVMLGRGAQGNPWLFREINHHLSSGNILPPPDQQEVAETMIQHLCQLHHFYGDILGPRIARKHVGWYVAHWGYGEDFRRSFNQLATAEQQLQQLQLFFRQRTTIDSDLFSSNFRGQAA
ncbi:MAG: tRNA dihydrouridine synthase DusB [Pseudomonadales bacterium]|nr:tRNA dihydrouridine synthase DusB [Pseudomonadales bacterium]